MDTALIAVAALIALVVLLYVGRNALQRRRLERQRQFAKAETEAEGHRSMAEDHTRKAAELQDEADLETERASRHEERAAEVQPKK